MLILAFATLVLPIANAELACSGNACNDVVVGHEGNLTTFKNIGEKKIRLTLRLAGLGVGAPCSDPSSYDLLPHGNKQGFQQAICDGKYQVDYE